MRKDVRNLWTVATVVAIAFVTIAGTGLARAQTYTILHTFTGPDGAAPVAALIRDTAGNLYGTTFYGGNLNLCNGSGCGIVFKLRPSGVETVLYTFTGGADGANPKGLFRNAAGDLYGVAAFGGDLSLCGGMGCGTVFQLSPPATVCRSAMCPWTETVVHTFTGPDGALPVGSLIQDASGNLYGATLSGGAGQYDGTVYEINAAGQESVLLSFNGGSNGFEPMAGVIQDSAGILYGTTYSGGITGYGLLYELNPTSGQENELYSFGGSGGSDGEYPADSLVFDQAGNLYGTTSEGGIFAGENCYGGCGVIFKFDSSDHLDVLYSFTGEADGWWPGGGVLRDAGGNLYGGTYYGGNLTACNPGGCGVVFKLEASGNLTVLHTFSDSPDGAYAAAALIQDAAGNLYGTTTAGGDSSCPLFGGCGVVFKITP